MKMNYKKIGIAVVAILIVVGSFMFFRKDEKNNSNDIEIITSLSKGGSFTYSNDTNMNSFYFIVAMKGVGISKLNFEPIFDKEVMYEVSYENIKKRNSLPIEYFLSQETDFDFEEMDEFNEYLSTRKIYDEYEENDEYEDYIKSYNSNDDFKKYFNGYSMYMVEIKIINAAERTNLTTVLFSRDVGEANLEGEFEKEVVYSEETNVSYLNTPSNSNGMYSIRNENYETAKLFDNQAKYTYNVSCSRELTFSDFRLSRYDLLDVSAYKANDEKLDNVSCKAGETISIDVEYDLGESYVNGDSIELSFAVDGRNETMYSPQIFIPSNHSLIMEEDYSGYSRYLEYKYNLR